MIDEYIINKDYLDDNMASGWPGSQIPPLMDIDANPIDNEDSWQVIRAYFKQHGLVSQQISSFNRFLERSVQEIVKEHQDNKIPVPPQFKTCIFQIFLISACRIGQ